MELTHFMQQMLKHPHDLESSLINWPSISTADICRRCWNPFNVEPFLPPQVCCPKCCWPIQKLASLLQTCRKIAGLRKARIGIGGGGSGSKFDATKRLKCVVLCRCEAAAPGLGKQDSPNREGTRVPQQVRTFSTGSDGSRSRIQSCVFCPVVMTGCSFPALSPTLLQVVGRQCWSPAKSEIKWASLSQSSQSTCCWVASCWARPEPVR